MKNLFDLTGKVAIVTGASSGLGRQFATVLAQAGANVALLARRIENLEALKLELAAVGSDALAIKCDVNNNESIKEAVSAVKGYYGRIDILVNNAGVATISPSELHTDEEWERVINTNLNAVFYMSREVGKVMIEQNYGKIINLGSIHSRVTMASFPIAAYCASKGGVMMLTKELAVEWAKYNITVNAIGPSYFPSEMTGGVTSDPNVLALINARCPMGRMGRPDELNGALIYFASDASTFTTGQLLNIDGGWTAA
ncbi:MAG: SDR family oxidoreductase [Coriobacteriia bacterium]|nr:SDR family oxidoreductase [Coriobacteriia bacterium]